MQPLIQMQVSSTSIFFQAHTSANQQYQHNCDDGGDFADFLHDQACTEKFPAAPAAAVLMGCNNVCQQWMNRQ